MENTKKIRCFTGKVVSAKMAKTAVVLVERLIKHPKYRKQYKVSKRFKVHDPKSECQVGNQVVFQECRPISKEKKWRVIEILKTKPCLPASLRRSFAEASRQE